MGWSLRRPLGPTISQLLPVKVKTPVSRFSSSFSSFSPREPESFVPKSSTVSPTLGIWVRLGKQFYRIVNKCYNHVKLTVQSWSVFVFVRKTSLTVRHLKGMWTVFVLSVCLDICNTWSVYLWPEKRRTFLDFFTYFCWNPRRGKLWLWCDTSLLPGLLP